MCREYESGDNFNPLPRKEGDVLSPKKFFDFFFISIHSLVKRETQIKNGLQERHRISIHSLVKRETQHQSCPQWLHIYFNPLPRKEGDLVQGFLKNPRKQFQSTPS